MIGPSGTGGGGTQLLNCGGMATNTRHTGCAMIRHPGGLDGCLSRSNRREVDVRIGKDPAVRVWRAWMTCRTDPVTARCNDAIFSSHPTWDCLLLITFDREAELDGSSAEMPCLVSCCGYVADSGCEFVNMKPSVAQNGTSCRPRPLERASQQPNLSAQVRNGETPNKVRPRERPT
jgi:hypothetical protein